MNFSRQKMTNLLDHLESSIRKLRSAASAKSTWNNYYNETILSQDYLDEKKKIFISLLGNRNYATALDAGTNNGFFSKLLVQNAAQITAIDFDAKCINHFYNEIKENKIKNILPLCVDITNPSPAVGFLNTERLSFLQRFRAELVTALALVHHLVLGKNIPLHDVAFFLSSICIKDLVIEFVPVTDPKAKQLVKNKSQYHQYDNADFERSFSEWFMIQDKQPIPSTERILYLMQKK